MNKIFKVFKIMGGAASIGGVIAAHLIQQNGFSITQQDGSLILFNDGSNESTLSSMNFSNTNNSSLLGVI